MSEQTPATAPAVNSATPQGSVTPSPAPQPTAPVTAPASTPTTQPAAAPGSIPYTRFAEVVGEKNEYKTKLQQAEQRAKELEAKLNQPSPQPQTPDPTPRQNWNMPINPNDMPPINWAETELGLKSDDPDNRDYIMKYWKATQELNKLKAGNQVDPAMQKVGELEQRITQMQTQAYEATRIEAWSQTESGIAKELGLEGRDDMDVLLNIARSSCPNIFNRYGQDVPIDVQMAEVGEVFKAALSKAKAQLDGNYENYHKRKIGLYKDNKNAEPASTRMPGNPAPINMDLDREAFHKGEITESEYKARVTAKMKSAFTNSG